VSTLLYVGGVQGERTSDLNYELTCECGALLGCLVMFTPDEFGVRRVMCGACRRTTFVQHLKITGVESPQMFLDAEKKRELARDGKDREAFVEHKQILESFRRRG